MTVVAAENIYFYHCQKRIQVEIAPLLIFERFIFYHIQATGKENLSAVTPLFLPPIKTTSLKVPIVMSLNSAKISIYKTSSIPAGLINS